MRTAAFNTAQFLDRAAALTPPCLYGLGVCLLAEKLLPLPAWLTPWAFAAVAACALVLLLAAEHLRSGRARFSPEYAAAWLDLRNHAGGKILAGATDAPTPTVLPATSLRPLCRALALPAVFVAAAALVPAPMPTERLSGADLERRVEQLEREVEAAAAADVLPKPEAEALRRQLERMRSLAENDPQAAAEALAALPERIEQARTRRLELAAGALEKALETAAGQKEAAGNAAGAPTESIEKTMAELRRSLESLERNEGGADNLPADLGRAIRDFSAAMDGDGGETGAGEARAGGTPDAKRIGDMLRALDAFGGELSRNDGESPGGGRSAARVGALSRLETVSEELEKMLLATGGDGEGGDEGGGGGDEYGSGGVSRGRGDAPLAFGDESQRGELEVEYLPLPPGGGGPDQLLRRERALPDEPLPPEEYRRSRRGGAGGAGPGRAGLGGEGVGPARARAVERYFEGISPAE